MWGTPGTVVTLFAIFLINKNISTVNQIAILETSICQLIKQCIYIQVKGLAQNSGPCTWAYIGLTHTSDGHNMSKT